MLIEEINKLAALIGEEADVWELFLGQLDVSEAKIKQLRSEAGSRARPAQYCLTRGIKHWVDSDESPTYEKIIAVFNGALLTNGPLAGRVEQFAKSLKRDTRSLTKGKIEF